MASGISLSATTFSDIGSGSTAIQQDPLQRSNVLQIGAQRAAIGGGLAASGSGLDIPRGSARRGEEVG
jgi:hypothetical protein